MARKKQSMLNGAVILVIAMGITKVIGAIFKIPLTNILGTIGRSYYSTAYDLFIPVYSIALAGLPVAVSKTVSHYAALERYRDVRRTYKVAKRIFFITGAVGVLLILAIAIPYTVTINKTESIYAVLCVAPSIFFCCAMSAHKGYYNGLRNMTPSAVCEVIEATVKMVLGLAFSKAALVYAEYKAKTIGANVFGLIVTEATTEQEILDATAPFAAAGAILGVTMGTVFATIYVSLRLKIKGDGIEIQELRTSPAPSEIKDLRRMLMKIAIPIVGSTLIFNVTNLIDTWTIQYRLDSVIAKDPATISQMYLNALTSGGYIDKVDQWKTFIHGAYEIAVDFKNMIPTVTTMLGISVIPVLSEAWTLKKQDEVKSSVESVIRICLMIAFPAGFGMAVLASPILKLMYGDLSSNEISAKVMLCYGLTVAVIAVCQPITNMLQTVGRADFPVKSIAIGAVLKIGVNFLLIGIPSINMYGAIIGTLVCYSISTGMNIFVLLKTTNVKLSVKNTIFKPFLCAALCAAGAYFTYNFASPILCDVTKLNISSRINGDTIAAGLAIIVAVIIYILMVLLTKCVVEADVVGLPKGEKIAKFMKKINCLG